MNEDFAGGYDRFFYDVVSFENPASALKSWWNGLTAEQAQTVVIIGYSIGTSAFFTGIILAAYEFEKHIKSLP